MCPSPTVLGDNGRWNGREETEALTPTGDNSGLYSLLHVIQTLKKLLHSSNSKERDSVVSHQHLVSRVLTPRLCFSCCSFSCTSFVHCPGEAGGHLWTHTFWGHLVLVQVLFLPPSATCVTLVSSTKEPHMPAGWLLSPSTEALTQDFWTPM